MYLIFLTFLFLVAPVSAQEIKPDTLTPANIFKSSEAPFVVGWNYFQVNTDQCNVQQILNEIQADGGSALDAKEMWIKKDNSWKSRQYSDTTKIKPDEILAFLSNQKFFFDLDPNVCLKTDDKRQEEIEKLRTPGSKNFFESALEGIRSKIDLLSLAVDATTNNFKKATSSGSGNYLDSDLVVSGKTTLAEVGITGKTIIGLIIVNPLDASINSMGETLKLQSLGMSNIEFMGGKVVMTKEGDMEITGDLRVVGEVTAEKVKAEEVETKKLCIEDVCVTRDELERLLKGN